MKGKMEKRSFKLWLYNYRNCKIFVFFTHPVCYIRIKNPSIDQLLKDIKKALWKILTFNIWVLRLWFELFNKDKSYTAKCKNSSKRICYDFKRTKELCYLLKLYRGGMKIKSNKEFIDVTSFVRALWKKQTIFFESTLNIRFSFR